MTILGIIAIIALTCAFVYPIAYNRGVDKTCGIYDRHVLTKVILCLGHALEHSDDENFKAVCTVIVNELLEGFEVD